LVKPIAAVGYPIMKSHVAVVIRSIGQDWRGGGVPEGPDG